MKILLVHHCSTIGGALNSGINVCKTIKSLGYSIDILIPQISEYIVDQIDGIRTIQSEYRIETFSYYNGGTSLIRAKAKRVINHNNKSGRKYYKQLFLQYDLILFNSMTLIPMLKYCKGLSCKTAFFIRETLKRNELSLLNKYYISKYQKADAIAFISNYDCMQWGISESKSFVIYNTAPIQPKHIEVKIDDHTLRLLYVGGLNRIKGIGTLLDAMRLMKNKNCELTILGTLGEYRLSNLFEAIAYLPYNIYQYKLHHKLDKIQNEISTNIIGLTKDPSLYYKSCDIVVIPSKTVHQARPIFEAGVYCKPVILPSFPNYCEFVRHRINGLVFRNGDAKDLAKVIDDCIEQRYHLDEMGSNNYAMYLRRHTTGVSEKALAEMLDYIYRLKRQH